ncbi:LPS assembly protein LptD [Fodinicurvata sp. EGI_FJ10296]|uniref:LPS-assembly protein LptD n=1 Tax=Fodinicurvata sp. EGI_FJ10296 TaxID=3231908 RepID=UPI003453F503
MTYRGWFLTTTVLAALALWPDTGPALADTAGGDDDGIDDRSEISSGANGTSGPPYSETAQLDTGEEEEAPEEPLLLEADDLTVDETLELVILTGSVRLAREGRIVLADRVTYNSRTEVVTATGNVVIIEESGDTYFADYAELEDGLAEGFIDRVGGLLIDDSRVAARRGIRRADGSVTMEDGIYSPCLPCAQNPDRPLIWQLRASEVEHDAESMDIIFRNVFFDVFGIPILYTPYFSTPDPRVRSRTGWLTPSFGSTSTLGQFIDLRYFVDIAPEQDATLRARPTGERGVLLSGEYRRRFESGRIEIDASANQSEVLEGGDEEFRGHVFAQGRYDIDENWRISGELNRTTDDTYLEDFDISDLDVLESNIQAEGFHGLNYHTAEVLSFQDLRGNVEDEPIILPWMRSSIVSEPARYFGGQLFADSELLYLRRPGEGRRSPLEGIGTFRASTDIGWRRTIYTPIGVVADVELANQASFWATQDLLDDNGQVAGETSDDTQAFLTVPRLHASARYPFVRHGETFTQVVEPIVAATIAPSFTSSDFEDIPRNDSAAPELDEISIFRPNRFAGIDRYDGGSRLTVGGRYSIDDGSGRSASILLAQSFRAEASDLFDPATGLADATSDIVGRVDASAGRWLDLNYRFRLDDETFEAKRHELTATSRLGPLGLMGRYTYLSDVAERQREELLLSGSAPLYGGWSTRGLYRIDLEADAVTTWQAGLRYTCECIVLDIAYQEQPQRDNRSILLRVSLANLGDIGFDFGFDAAENE